MKTIPLPSHRESYTPTSHSSDRSRLRSILGGLAAIVAFTGLPAKAQCPVVELASGLSRPVAIAQSSQGNLLISETTSRVPNTGRISIVDLSGHRRTLLSGLPSGIADVGDPLGVTGLFLRGRTLFVLIGVGDVAIGAVRGARAERQGTCKGKS